MPVNYGLFQFASPPRTATRWISEAAHMAGLRQIGSGDVHVPHSPDPSIVKLTCIRDPIRWVESFYDEIYPGKIGVESVDSLHPEKYAYSLDDFIGSLIDRPRSVTRMFETYNADVAIKVEELPWSFIEFLESVGVNRNKAEMCVGLRAMNFRRHRLVWQPLLKTKLILLEDEFVERYDYI